MEINNIDPNSDWGKDILTLFKEKVVEPFNKLVKGMGSLPPEIAVPSAKPEEKSKTLYSDVLIMNEKMELLLLSRSARNDFQPSKWCLPGGHVDEGESHTDAAYRELYEETGLLGIELSEFNHVVKEDCEIAIYCGMCETSQPIHLDNDEHYQYTFVPLEDLLSYDLMCDLKDNFMDWFDLSPTPEVPEINLDKVHLITKSFETIEESFNKGEIELDIFLENKINFIKLIDFYKSTADDENLTPKDKPKKKNDSSEEEDENDEEANDSPGSSPEDDRPDDGNDAKPPVKKKPKKTPTVNQSTPDWQSEEGMS